MNKEYTQIISGQLPDSAPSKVSGALSYHSSNYVMYNLDFQSGEYIFMSNSIKLLTGYTKNELSKLGFKTIIKEAYSDEIDRYCVKGNLSLNVKEFHTKYLIETKSGDQKWIEDNSFVYIDKNGDHLNSVGILRDSSSFHMFIDKLNEEKNNLDKIFDLSESMLLQFDQDLNIVMINKKGCRVIGGDKKEIIGKNINELIPKHLQSNFEQYIDDLINGKENLKENTIGKLKTLDKKIKVIEWHNTILRDNKGELVSFIATGQEITERRKEEKIPEDHFGNS